MALFGKRGSLSYFREDGRVVPSDVILTREMLVKARKEIICFYYVVYCIRGKKKLGI